MPTSLQVIILPLFAFLFPAGADGTFNPKFCLELNKKSETGPCLAIWNNGIPPWEDPEVLKLVSSQKRDVKPPRVANKTESNEFISNSLTIRSQVTETCCGSNKSCEQMMASVNIMLGKNCDQRGSYSFIGDSKARMLLRDKTKGLPAPAAINVSLCFDSDGRPTTNLHVVRHELGHACTDIHRILQLEGKSRVANDSYNTWLDLHSESGCEKLKAYHPKVYQLAFASIQNGREILDCLFSEAKGNGKAAVCELRRLEEGVAEALAHLSNKKELANSIPEPSCGAASDKFHPSTNSVLKCLINYSQEFRERVLKQVCAEADQ